MSEAKYLPGSIKLRSTQYGPVLKMSLPATDAIKFIQENAGDEGWIRFDIRERRQPSESGATHYAKLDTWKPYRTQQRPQQAPPSQPGFEDSPISDDDVPF